MNLQSLLDGLRRDVVTSGRRHRRRPAVAGQSCSPISQTLETKTLLAATSFAAGVLTIDFDAPGESLAVANDGADILVTSSAVVSGHGATFPSAGVTRLVVTDSGNLGSQSLTFGAGAGLSLSGGLSTTGIESVIVNSTLTATGVSAISMLAPQSITVSANVTGGSGGVSLTGQGLAALNTVGVAVRNGAVVSTTGTGQLQVAGTGGSGSGNRNYGVAVESAGRIRATGSGSLSVFGIGGNGTGSENYGVLVSGAGVATVTVIGSAGGDVFVNGQGGGGGGNGSDNYGVHLRNAFAFIESGGSGQVDVVGFGGVGSGTGNTGVYLASAGSQIHSTGGPVSVMGVGSASAPAINLVAGGIYSSQNAAITITADSLTVSAAAEVSSQSGTTTIQPRTAGTKIDLGGADVLTGSVLTLGLTSAELNRITAGRLIVGRDDLATGTVTVSSAVNPLYASALSVVTARNIVVNANVTGGVEGVVLRANQQLTPLAEDFDGIRIQGGARVSAAALGSVRLAGRGGVVNTSFNIGVIVDGIGTSVTSGGGLVEVIGTGGGSGGSGSNWGIFVTRSATITAGGLGSVSIIGNGGAGTGAYNYGVFVEIAGVISSNGGDVTVTGLGVGAAGGGGYNQGVSLIGGARISAGGTGRVEVTGTGGIGNSNNWGVYVESGTTQITSSGGDVSVLGYGGNGIGASSYDYGVRLNSGQVRATGAGKTTVFGQGGTGSGGRQYGVRIFGSAGLITSDGGAVSVTGQGGGVTGGGGYNSGIYITEGGKITAGGAGNVSVTGTGGIGSSNNWGVYVQDTATQITSSGGDVSVSGYGGSQSGNWDYGVWVNWGQIAATGGGTTTVFGRGGTGSGSEKQGLLVFGTTGQISSGGGSVSVTGQAGGANSTGIWIDSSGTLSSGGNASITVMTDGLSLPSGSINSGTGTTTIQPRTAGTKIDLGGADVLTRSVLTLGLTSAELNRITAGRLIIGRDDLATGTVTVSSAVNPLSASALSVVSARDIVVNANVTGGVEGLVLRANQQLTPATENFDGIRIQGGARVSAAALGSVRLAGRGGVVSTSYNAGVTVDGIGTTVTSGGGLVEVIGTGGGSGGSGSNWGVFVTRSAQVTAGGLGSVSIIGNGGAGTGAYNYGVFLEFSGVISSNGGDVTVTGQGGGTIGGGRYNQGVIVVGTARISAGGIGAVSVTGTGGMGNSDNRGVYVQDTGSQITSSGGNVSVFGYGGSQSGNYDYGVWVNWGQIGATGAGTTTVFGKGGTGLGIEKQGVILFGTTGQISSGGGAVTVTGQAGGSNSPSIWIDYAGTISSAGNASVTLTTDSLLLPSGSISSGNGVTTIQPNTAGTRIDLGGTDVLSGSVLTLGLTSAELNRITAGGLIVGRDDMATGTITVSAAINPTGAAGLSVVTARNIVVNASVTGGINGLKLIANRQAIPTNGDFIGISTANSAIVSANGSVELAATGGTGTVSGSYGVYITSSTVSSVSGDVKVIGYGGSGTGTSNYGVLVSLGGLVTSGGGHVDVNGTGGSGTGSSNVGVFLSNSGRIASGGVGRVLVTGTGGSGNGGGNHGVRLSGLSSTITSGGTGSVTVLGTGGNGAGGSNSGIFLNGNSSISNQILISSGGGDVYLNGQGGGGAGSGSLNRGVYATNPYIAITAGGSGTVTVVGAGGSGTGSSNEGVSFSGNGVQIASAGGAVNITGIGTPNSAAISFSSFAAIRSGSNAPIAITTDSLSLSNAVINSGTGMTTIQPRTAATKVDLGGADVLSGSPRTLGLTSAELNSITAGQLVVGRDDIATGTVTVSSAVSPVSANALTVTTARDIVVNANLTGGAQGLMLRANQQAATTAENFDGIRVLNGARVSTSGNGPVRLDLNQANTLSDDRGNI